MLIETDPTYVAPTYVYQDLRLKKKKQQKTIRYAEEKIYEILRNKLVT